MVKPLLIALALCTVSAPAYAHGIYFPPAEAWYGVSGALFVAFAAAASLPGNFLYRILYFIAALAGAAACAIALLQINDVLLRENNRSEGAWLIKFFVPAACVAAAWLTAVLASRLTLGSQAPKASRLLFGIWVVLTLLSILVPLFYGVSPSRYANTFFVSTVLPFVSAIIVVIAAIAGFAIKVNIRTDHGFRRFFLYWPFVTMLMLLFCDVIRFPGQQIVQIVVWYPLLLGLPIGAIVFVRRRLKQKAQPPPQNP